MQTRKAQGTTEKEAKKIRQHRRWAQKKIGLSSLAPAFLKSALSGLEKWIPMGARDERQNEERRKGRKRGESGRKGSPSAVAAVNLLLGGAPDPCTLPSPFLTTLLAKEKLRTRQVQSNWKRRGL